MEVCTRDGGDGVQCWNVEPITAYARDRTARKAGLSGANPDVVATPGTITCYGCTALDYGHGFGCTAQLTQTLYHVRGEIAPRTADATASLSTIPGFRGRIDADATQQSPQPASGEQR